MKKMFSHLLCAVLVILCSALLPIMLFFANVGAVKFYEIAIFIGIYAVIGLGVFVVLRFILKSEYKAGLAAGFFILIFQNSGRLAKIMPYKFVLVIFLLVAGGLIFAVWKLLKDDIAKLFVPVLSVVLTMLLVMNTVISISKIVSVANADKEIQKEIDEQYEYILSCKDGERTTEELPNIYFIITDEYAGFNSLEKYYDYDNAQFKAFLENRKFNLSLNSTNYMEQTFECLANVFNLEVSENNSYAKTSEAYCQKKIKNGVLFKLVESLGYTITVAQTLDVVDYESETDVFGDKWSSTDTGDSTIDLMVAPSMLAPFTDKIRSVLNGVPLDYFVGSARIVSQGQAGIDPLLYFAESENTGKENSFNLCYVSFPHTPFVYDENGNVIDGVEHSADWGEKSYYLNQLKYCTTLLENTIDNIIENDPEAIIVLMSDHGVRDHSDEVSGAEWMSEMTPKDSADILCGVYYGGDEFDGIEGMCGSNVLISVINKAWGYDIPLIGQSDDMYHKK